MSGKWRWHFVNDDDAAAIGDDPTDFSNAKVVRHLTEERSVYYRDGLFFKFYQHRCRNLSEKLQMLLSPTAKQEFRAIMCLRRHRIPVVEPVGYGVCGTSSMLITREEKSCLSIMEYLNRRLNRGEAIPEPFLIGWSRFLARFIASGLYFPDFHCGNVLYNEAEERFVLVDPLGLKRNLFNRSERIIRMLKREFGVVMEFASRPLLERMLAEIDPSDPAGFYRRLMVYNAEYVKKSCMRNHKRVKKFRAGASTRVIDGIRIKQCSCQVPFLLDGTEKITLPPDAAAELWERDYILSLYHLPLLRVVARDETDGTLYRQLSGPGEVPEAEREDLLARLELTGFRREEFDCCTNAAGTAVLRDRKFFPAGDGRTA